uniref:Cold-regulated COR413im n=1 Tax=Phlox subulata TaxID=103544 RepID=A0A1B2BI35_9ERIC|nr:cold-regulated COR413im [Phlox subulata]
MMMMSVCLSSPRPASSLCNSKQSFLLSPKSQLQQINPPLLRLPHFAEFRSSFVGGGGFNPLLRNSRKKTKTKTKKGGFGGAVCYSSPLLAPHNLQWISTVSIAVLMVARGTAIQKSFLVPLFALQAHPNIIYWLKGEYGLWTAFLAILARLFFSFPGELELPFVSLLLAIVAPPQVTQLRGTQGGIIASFLIAGYLGYQHFNGAGNLKSAAEQGSIIPTLAISSLIGTFCLLLARF